MYQLKAIILQIFHWLTKIYVSFLFKGKHVYVVNGLRRSGNHAFINWFSSALEGEQVIHKVGRISWSLSKKTLLFNEVNQRGTFVFLSDVIMHRELIKNSKYLLISLEDYMPKTNFDPFIPETAMKISVTRSILNLIASRLQRAVNQAKLGLDGGDMRIDNDFFHTARWLKNSDKKGWIIWNYDSWLNDNNGYRENFIKQFNLKNNISTNISNHGGGSSFSGQNGIPSADEATNRWRSIDWPERVLRLLENFLNDNLLSEKESLFVREALVKIERANIM